MNPSIEYIFHIVEQNSTIWRHVNGLVCVHTFFGDFYINLCSYRENNIPVISINVDNVRDNINDIFDITYQEGTNEYNRLLPIYTKAIKEGIQISSGSLAV